MCLNSANSEWQCFLQFSGKAPYFFLKIKRYLKNLEQYNTQTFKHRALAIHTIQIYISPNASAVEGNIKLAEDVNKRLQPQNHPCTRTTAQSIPSPLTNQHQPFWLYSGIFDLNPPPPPPNNNKKQQHTNNTSNKQKPIPVFQDIDARYSWWKKSIN